MPELHDSNGSQKCRQEKDQVPLGQVPVLAGADKAHTRPLEKEASEVHDPRRKAPQRRQTL